MHLDDVFDGDILPDEVDRWLNQFAADERPVASRLLGGFRYYSLRRMNAALRRLHEALVRHSGDSAEQLRYVPVGYVAKSGAAIAYYFRKQNMLREDRFISSADISVFESDNTLIPVLLDDFIGSGHQSLQVVQELRSAAPGITQPIIVAAVVGFRPGMRLLERQHDVSAIAADIIDELDLPFAEPSPLFESAEERAKALAVIERYGARLYPQYPLGYAHNQGLIGFFYSTPNNTLPIFWSSDANWSPLLPHGESFRDPSYLFGPPSGLAKHLVVRGPQRPFVETAELEKYEIPEELAVKIFGEFHQTPIFLVLAPILKELKVEVPAFTALLNVIAKMRNNEHEQKPVRATVMIAPGESALSKSGVVVAEAADGITLGNLDELIAMSQFVDGLAGGVVVRPDGRIHGVAMFPPGESKDDEFLPQRYRSAANASRAAEALLLLFTGTGRIFVFYRGLRILSFRNAAWHLQMLDLRPGVAALARQHRVKKRVLEELVRVALRMADEAKGALITVGDHESVLALSDRPKTAHLKFAPIQLGAVADEALTGLMAQDGATIVSSDGAVIQAMTFLRPPAGTEAEEEVGRGSKHSTAAKISRATKALTIAVSVDGRITVYSVGRMKLKLMG